MSKIIVVDDSRVVSKLLTDMLVSKGGYDVITCNTVDDAITALNNKQIAVSLVVTDLIMPGKDGNDLVDYMHTMPHRPKIIVISGGSAGTVDATTAVMSVQDRVETVLVKPFPPEKLIAAVKKLIG